MPKIIYYRDKCIGCCSCLEHSNLWKISKEDGKAILLNSEKKKDTYVKEIDISEVEESVKAAKDCPVGIIKVK